MTNQMKKQLRKIVQVTVLTAALTLPLALGNQASAQSASKWEYYGQSPTSNNPDATTGTYKRNLETGEVVKLSDTYSMGKADEQDGWVYYTTVAPLDDSEGFGQGIVPGYMNKMKTDGSGAVQLTNIRVNDLAVSGNWIVFSAFGGVEKSDKSEDKPEQLMKMKTDGTGLSTFVDDQSLSVVADGEWIYFRSAKNDNKLYRAQADGSGLSQVTDVPAEDYWFGYDVSNGVVVYTAYIDNSQAGSYAIKGDGTGKIKLTSDDAETASLKSVSSEWIYFYESVIDEGEEVLYKIKHDGTGKVKTTEAEANAAAAKAAEVSPNTGGGTDTAKPDAGASFTDSAGHWSEKTIAWAKSNNIAAGYEDGTFKPDKKVTEEEFLRMFMASFGIQNNVKDNRWSDAYYAIAAKNGYPVKGADNVGAKETEITRLAVAEIIAAADGKKASGNAAIQFLLDSGYSNGKTAATVEGYAGNDTLTRAEAIQFIKNVKDSGFKVLKSVK
jgi:Domain of unknown function (DUF5050)/S-layer homology domain